MNAVRIVEESGTESLHEASCVTSEEEDAAVNRWRAGGYDESMTMAETSAAMRGFSQDTDPGGLSRVQKS